MSFEYIQRTYCVPAAFGGRIEYRGGPRPQLGTITAFDGGHLLIKLDGDKAPKRFHPTWEMRYIHEPQGDGPQADADVGPNGGVA